METKKILIVEDEPVVAMELQETLLDLGYFVTAIVDAGGNALIEVQTHPPDLVLMDIRLSGSIDGIEAAHLIRFAFNTPVVFLTAFAEDETLQRALHSFPFGYLTKPVKASDLRAAISLALYNAGLEKERQKAVSDLERSRSEYRELVQSANSIIMKFDTAGNITFMNDYAQCFFGYSQEEALGENALGTIVPEIESTGRDLKDMVQKLLKNPEDYKINENENICKNGKRAWVHWTNHRITDSNGQTLGLLSIGNDRSEQKQIELALARSEQRFALAQKSAKMGTWEWDIPTNQLEWSDGIESIFGFEVGEFDETYEAFRNSIHPDDRLAVRQAIKDALEGVRKYHIEHRIVWPDGTIHWVEEIGTVFRDEHAKPNKMIGIVIDITLRKETEWAKEDIENIMHHDLVSPLHAVVGFPQVLLSRTELTDRQRKYILYIQEAGEEMQKIIDSYLDMSRMEKGRYQLRASPLDLNSVVSQVINDMSILAQKKSVHFNLAISNLSPTDTPSVIAYGEETLCYSLFSNLIKNAVEASPEEGTVRVGLSQAQDQVEAAIHNDGVVPVQIRNQFFEKYNSFGKEGGTGWGTYSAKLMVETQGGKISMQTSESEGTTLFVTLPGHNAP